MNLQCLFNDESTNTGRQSGLDAIKSIAIFFMIMIHIYETFTAYQNMDMGIFGTVLEFLDGPFGAPAFMICMGIGMVYTSHNAPAQLIRRGVHLLVFAYVLNILRGTIPHLLFFWIKDQFDMAEIIYFTFNIDILHLAGLCFILTGIFKKCNAKLYQIFFISILMQAFGTMLLQIELSNSFLKYFLGLFIYTGEASCFPLLLWFIYPVLGMIIGSILKHVAGLDSFHILLAKLCIPVFMGFTCYLISTSKSPVAFYTLQDDICYKQNFLGTIYSVTIFGITKSLFYFLNKKSWTQMLVKPCRYIGKNLNAIYINQWLIISWVSILLDLCNLNRLSFALLIPITTVIYVISILMAKYSNRFVRKFL